MPEDRSKQGESAAPQPVEEDPVADKQESLDTLPPPPSLSSELDALKTLPPAPEEELLQGWEHKKLGGRFELLEKIGEGGMGVVFRARDVELDEVVAVKVLQRALTQGAEDIRRFKREIKTARRISHPNVIRIHEFGIEDGEAFIVMELLTGGDLSELIDSELPEFDEALNIAIAIADGVAAAHDEGIVHRDLKPHNVLFDDKANVKLLDFGIARFTASKTQTRGMIGTPHYMSPEQADGQPVSTQSDVYSLGVLYFELFTGRLPFESDSVARLAIAHVSLDPPRPSTLRPELSPAVEAIILKALSKKKEDRYRDAHELANELRRVRDGTAAIPVPRSVRRSARRPLIATAIAAGLFVVGALAITINDRIERAQQTQATPESTATGVLALARPLRSCRTTASRR